MKLLKKPLCLAMPGVAGMLLGLSLLVGQAADQVRRLGDLADVFGVAHVDGKYWLTEEDFLNEGADQVLATGSKVIKLYLSPSRYPWHTHWEPHLSNLLAVARAPYFQSVFAKPFRTYILTAYAVGRADHYWAAGLNATQEADETQQFYDLTKYLLTTYRGTGKTFVLQHWEGDWALRDGAPKEYDASFIPSSTAVQGMIRWLNARQAGIQRARQEIGPSDVHVYGATEVNRVEDSLAGKPGVANAVLPFTTVDLASYSCYNFLDSPDRLRQAVDYIAAHLPATAVFGQNARSVYLGELGYPENGQGGAGTLNQRLDNALAVVQERQLPWAVFWEIYCNEPVTAGLPLPLNGKTNNNNLRGYWMIKPDGTPGMAWHRYRRLFATTNPQLATTQALKAALVQVFCDAFARSDGPELGPGWSQAAHYGVVHEQIAQHRLRFEIPDGRDIPWGSATLDLSNRAVLGHGLVPGDYVEIRLHRLSEQGGLGIELFDSDQLRVGSDLKSGASGLQAWNGTTWVLVAFDDHGRPAHFDWNQPHTLGVRFDSADGHRTTFSYYVDGQYAGSWLVATGHKTLDKVGVYAQTRTAGSAFEFEDLRVYASKQARAR